MKRGERVQVRRTLCVLLLAVLSSLVLVDCSRKASVYGTVYEAPEGMRSGRAAADFAGGKPLEWVEVNLYLGESTSASLGAQELTGEEGGYSALSLSWSWNDRYLVTFSKKGYESFSTIVEIPQPPGDLVLDVCLAPIKEAPPQ